MLLHAHTRTRPSPGLSRLAMRSAALAKSGPAIAARVCPERAPLEFERQLQADHIKQRRQTK